eukprot:CAMPEP_0175449256 /NCGR_PEP_ID=MMETSP0095-20121207/61749_1 /TAXON_ID=311494 /ORGANISM="Alexandrium monilatum, Strain CCMP3105" /LENGTH=103 /DNA_ID=CAMNT_0016749669 /DNA_START=70 /DNA_END=382 /DNA_ORIENTATION=+
MAQDTRAAAQLETAAASLPAASRAGEASWSRAGPPRRPAPSCPQRWACRGPQFAHRAPADARPPLAAELPVADALGVAQGCLQGDLRVVAVASTEAVLGIHGQ